MLPRLVDLLIKVASTGVSDREAQDALDALDRLERDKPTAGQLARYTALGAVAGPAVKTLGRVIESGPTGALGSPRRLAAEAVGGALTTGAIPLVRQQVEKQVQKNTLKRYLDEGKTAAAPPSSEEVHPSKPLWKKVLPVAAGVAAGAGAYAGLRRFRPSAVPELRALQEAAEKTKGLAIATSNPEGRAMRSALFGAKDIPHTGGEGAAETILHHTGATKKPFGAVNVNAGVLPDALDDKYTFSRLMEHGTGGAAGLAGSTPQTHLLADRLKEVPLENLHRAYPQGYVIKPRTGSMSKAEDLITEATDLKHPRVQEALNNPKHFIIQEKIPIQNEFRVHMVNNVPVTAAHRRIPNETVRNLWDKHMGGGGGGFVPVMGDERESLMNFARESTKHLGDTAEGHLLGKSENLHHALDIARLPDGSFKLIESNPTPGTLMNPIVNRQVQQAITGRMPKDVAALGALGLGTAATGAAYGVQHGADQKIASAFQRLGVKFASTWESMQKLGGVAPGLVTQPMSKLFSQAGKTLKPQNIAAGLMGPRATPAGVPTPKMVPGGPSAGPPRPPPGGSLRPAGQLARAPGGAPPMAGSRPGLFAPMPGPSPFAPQPVGV